MNMLPVLLLLCLINSPKQAHLNATLARAAALGDTSKASVQLQEGADVNFHTLIGQTPLELAVEYHHFETARLLLEHGAHVNCESSFGTPLTWAAADDDVALTKLLLDRGAWVDYGGYLSAPLIQALLSITDMSTNTINAVQMAIEISPDTPHNRRLAKLIVDKEREQYLRQHDSLSPATVHERRRQSIKILKMLLTHGADVNRKGVVGISPLMDASIAGDVECAMLLIDHGAKIDAKDEKGATALLYASSSNKMELVKFLLSKGAEINVQTNDGTIALFDAIQGQNVEMVQLLLRHGANPNLSSKSDETVLSMAKRYGNPEIITLLQDAGAKK